MSLGSLTPNLLVCWQVKELSELAKAIKAGQYF